MRGALNVSSLSQNKGQIARCTIQRMCVNIYKQVVRTLSRSTSLPYGEASTCPCLRGEPLAGFLHRKEVIQPQVPLRLPCYDFIPVTSLALGRCLLAVGARTSGETSFHDVTGGVYKTRERIHGAVADAPLLAIPTSWSRVADSNLN